MITECKHFVEYFAPGIIVPETRVEETQVRNPAMVKIGEGCYAFRFFSRTEVVGDDGEILRGPCKNHSGTYYIPECRVLDVEQAALEHGEESILVRNMKCNDIAKVISTPYGQSFPMREGDVVLDRKSD
jgi:hypothetical protein